MAVIHQMMVYGLGIDTQESPCQSLLQSSMASMFPSRVCAPVDSRMGFMTHVQDSIDDFEKIKRSCEEVQVIQNGKTCGSTGTEFKQCSFTQSKPQFVCQCRPQDPPKGQSCGFNGCPKRCHYDVKDQASGTCFPGDALVMTPTGPKSLESVMVGDLVLSLNDDTMTKEFSPVTHWIHRAPETRTRYLIIETADGNKVEISELHNIAVVRKGVEHVSYVFAEEIQEGDHLVGSGDSLESTTSLSLVTNITLTINKGAFAPLTESGTIFVSARTARKHSSTGFVAAHCFAHVGHVKLFHAIFKQILSVFDWLGGIKEMMMMTWQQSPQEMEMTDKLDNHGEFVHPIAKALVSAFPFTLTLESRKRGCML